MKLKQILFLSYLLSFILKADDTLIPGYNIPQTPLYVGGYISANYDGKREDKLLFDDIALLFYGNYEKFDLLGEIEISDVPLKKKALRIHTERFRIAYYLYDDTTLYLGKFNSNTGFWNQIPINILEDTTTYPHIMENIFPKLTTGISIYQSFEEGEREISLTIQHNNDLDKHYNNIIVDRHYSLGYKDTMDEFVWRLSGGYYKSVDNRDYFYAGAGIRKEFLNYTLLSELFTKRGEKKRDIPYDGYLQLTWHMFYMHDLVFRSEFYNDESMKIKENISLLGYTFRPMPSFSIKTEYIRHSKLSKNRFVFSISAMF